MTTIDNASFISSLESRGLQTTDLYSENETNFVQYGEALSADLKQELLQSFDNEQDYILQQKVSELFQSTNVVDSGSFISACESLGLSCSVDYQSTSYIVDYKQSQSGEVVDGAIAIYTISDGQGGEIKIADANGNGYLETEELFLNEILGDINAGLVSGGTGSAAGANAVKQISQEEFNAQVEEYLKVGFTKEEATVLANTALGTSNGYYTGACKSATQDEFNNLVDMGLKSGLSKETAILQARNQLIAQGALNTDLLYYTGLGVEENTENEEVNTEIAEEPQETEDANEGKSFISLTVEKEEDKEEAA